MVEHHLAMVGVAGSNPVFRFHQHAGVAELVDARDLKSRGWFQPYRFDSSSWHLVLEALVYARASFFSNPRKRLPRYAKIGLITDERGF